MYKKISIRKIRLGFDDINLVNVMCKLKNKI